LAAFSASMELSAARQPKNNKAVKKIVLAY
jgi:hypothetical protein